jgi:hypothetical protein
MFGCWKAELCDACALYSAMPPEMNARAPASPLLLPLPPQKESKSIDTTGALNTALGDLALQDNDATGDGTANFNTAVGAQALQSNENGSSNNAVGYNALAANDDGLFNQAMGADALSGNVSGVSNVAIGDATFADNVSGSFNTVIGDVAGAGVNGDDNIYIGATVGPAAGPAGANESGIIRIGDPEFINACFIGGISGVPVTGDTVVVNADGQLGIAEAGSPLSLKEVLKERQVVQQLKATTEK